MLRMKPHSIVKIALATPLRKTFDYLSAGIACAIGSRVAVSFGKNDMMGIVVGFSDTTDIPENKLKPILACLDDVPLLDQTLMSLYQWASDYYQHPIGYVMVATLPKKIQDGKKNIALREKHQALAQPENTEVALTLTDEQQAAVDAILFERKFQPFLLAGVTGSGKTEVYLRVIEKILQEKKQALVLVPEISLTPQTVSRFKTRFDVPILLSHSGLTDAVRFQSWMDAVTDQPCIVIGTRSAVFAPLKNLGVIVVDEEHDVSFKQQNGFRYSARDVAVMRAKLTNIPIVLGTATPSLETWKNAEEKKYKRLVLTQRTGAAILPTIITHNIRSEKLHNGLSEKLIETMHRHLNAGNQVLLYLNRRGYAPLLLCHHCGWSAQCPHCDARLTAHDRPKKLWCHHCGYQAEWQRICGECRQSELLLLGLGTEQLETAMQKWFPDKVVVRIDRDTIQNFKTLEESLAKIRNREVDILIGTQMLVKGHHFENVTLVATIDVDHALFSSDFRAVERLGQSLIQVAGRAGRAEKKGEVFVQTHHPEHPLLKKLFEAHYDAFSNALLEERTQAGLPPLAHMIDFRAEAKQKEVAHRFLSAAKLRLQQKNSMRIAGPFPSWMEKKAGVYRGQLTLQSSHRPKLKKKLSGFLLELDSKKIDAGIKWILDV